VASSLANSPAKAQHKRTSDFTWLEQQCEELNRKTEAYLKEPRQPMRRSRTRPALSIDVENIGKVDLDHSTVKSKIKPFIKTKRLPKKKRAALKQVSSDVNKVRSEGVQLPPQYQRRLSKY
jgi:hypothetical protein